MTTVTVTFEIELPHFLRRIGLPSAGRFYHCYFSLGKTANVRIVSDRGIRNSVKVLLT